MDNGTRDELLSRLAEAIGSVTTAHPTAGRHRRTARRRKDHAGRRARRRSAQRRAARSSARRSRASFSPGHSAIGAASTLPKAAIYDSFDFDALHRVLLDPLGPGGDRRFQQAVYDRRTDTALSQPVTTAPADAVLLFDGVFLLRPELIDRWDLRIFVSAAFEADTGSRPDPRPGAVRIRHRSRATPPQPLQTLPTALLRHSPARPITPTSSCTTTSPSSRHGRPDHSDQIHRI